MPQFSALSKERLASCDMRLQIIFNTVIQRVDCVILEGHRGEAAQNEAFRKGNSKLKWPNGNHNAIPSRAVDVAPFLPDVKIDWGDLVAFGRLMGYVQAIADARQIKLRFGLDWDGDWRTVGRDPNESFLDAPHVELLDP